MRSLLDRNSYLTHLSLCDDPPVGLNELIDYLVGYEMNLYLESLTYKTSHLADDRDYERIIQELAMFPKLSLLEIEGCNVCSIENLLVCLALPDLKTLSFPCTNLDEWDPDEFFDAFEANFPRKLNLLILSTPSHGRAYELREYIPTGWKWRINVAHEKYGIHVTFNSS